MIRRSPERSRVAAADGIQRRNDCRYSALSSGPLRHTDYTPGGIFDPLFADLLAGDIAGINASTLACGLVRVRELGKLQQRVGLRAAKAQDALELLPRFREISQPSGRSFAGAPGTADQTIF
jgi:hypothetical protein